MPKGLAQAYLVERSPPPHTHTLLLLSQAKMTNSNPDLRFRVELWSPAASRETHSKVRAATDGHPHRTQSIPFLRNRFRGSLFQCQPGSLPPQGKPHAPPYSHILNPITRAPQFRPPGFKFSGYLPFYLVPLDKGLHLSYITFL